MPIELWLDDLDEPQRRAARAVLAVARRYRGLVIEAVSVGVLIKRVRTVVELRPRKRWLDLSLVTPARIDSDRVARRGDVAAGAWSVVHLRDQRDVDREVRAWIALALRA